MTYVWFWLKLPFWPQNIKKKNCPCWFVWDASSFPHRIHSSKPGRVYWFKRVWAGSQSGLRKHKPVVRQLRVWWESSTNTPQFGQHPPASPTTPSSIFGQGLPTIQVNPLFGPLPTTTTEPKPGMFSKVSSSSSLFAQPDHTTDGDTCSNVWQVAGHFLVRLWCQRQVVCIVLGLGPYSTRNPQWLTTEESLQENRDKRGMSCNCLPALVWFILFAGTRKMLLWTRLSSHSDPGSTDWPTDVPLYLSTICPGNN